jgi:rRNA maturation endonuclease Nob1
MKKMGYMCTRTFNKECDGCQECMPTPHYYCPICGEEVYETVFVKDDGEIIGCENCAEIKEPHEVLKNEADE